MMDNNDNNIDETLNSVTGDASGLEDDALENDGITEEEVDDTEDTQETENGESEGAEESAEETPEEVHVTKFPTESSEGFADKLKNLSRNQLMCIGGVGVAIIAVIIAIIVLATSGKKVDNEVITIASTAVTKSTETATTAEQATTIPVVQAEKDVSFDELSQTNEDIYAYIYIPGTEIDYPILQSNESLGENYYLNYTVNNYYAWYGSLYTQFTYNKKDFTDKNTIIYGHAASRNINSVMFTQLHYYEDEEFLKTNPYIYIYYGEEQLKYQIFAAINFTDVLIPAKYGVTDGASMVQFVNDAKTTYGGVIDESVVIDEDSRIITLSTCTMYPDYDESKRFLVIAKLVEEAVVQK